MWVNLNMDIEHICNKRELKNSSASCAINVNDCVCVCDLLPELSVYSGR